MDNPRLILTTALEKAGYTVFKQGSLGDDETPSKFITYYQVSSNDTAFYDNKPKETQYLFQVALYSNAMADILTASKDIDAILLPLGFTRNGKGRDNGYENDTQKHGWINDYYYQERNDSQ